MPGFTSIQSFWGRRIGKKFVPADWMVHRMPAHQSLWRHLRIQMPLRFWMRGVFQKKINLCRPLYPSSSCFARALCCDGNGKYVCVENKQWRKFTPHLVLREFPHLLGIRFESLHDVYHWTLSGESDITEPDALRKNRKSASRFDVDLDGHWMYRSVSDLLMEWATINAAECGLDRYYFPSERAAWKRNAGEVHHPWLQQRRFWSQKTTSALYKVIK